MPVSIPHTMFYLQRVLFITFLFLGYLNHASFTIAMTSDINKVDQNQTTDEILHENFTTSLSLEMESDERNKVTLNKSSITINKRKVRHNRYQKLDNFFKKISQFDETVQKTADEPDVIAINNSRSESRQLSTSGSDLADNNNYYVSSEASESSSEITENPSDKYSSQNRQNTVLTFGTQFEESSIDDDEDDEDDDEDGDYDESEDETRDTSYLFLNQTSLSQDDIDEGFKQYIKSLIANGWAFSPKPSQIIAEDKLQNSNEDKDWVYRSQADGHVDSASGIKWVYYGTRAEIETSRVQPRRNQSANQKATQHYIQMTKEGACKLPQRRVVNVQSLYPNPSKTYIPRCTFLHYCGDDTGCCLLDSMTCAPKRTEQVELYFYTTVIGKDGNMIEKMIFTNHTECECVIKRIDYMVKDETSSVLSLQSRPLMTEVLDMPDVTTEAPPLPKKCLCPTEFSVHILKDGECECDCFNRQKDCLRKKKGREYFSLKDRKCIYSGQCQTPNCQYGDYIESTGRCPKRLEGNYGMHKKIYGK